MVQIVVKQDITLEKCTGQIENINILFYHVAKMKQIAIVIFHLLKIVAWHYQLVCDCRLIIVTVTLF